MSGYDLQYGNYDNREISFDDIKACLEPLFSQKIVTSSTYKYALMDAIISCIQEVDDRYVLSYNKIFESFVCKYWWLVINNDLKQSAQTKDGRQTQVEKLVKGAVLNHGLDTNDNIMSLGSDGYFNLVKQAKAECSRYVLGALYEDTNRLLYSFSNKTETITINPQAYKYLYINRDTLLLQNNYSWAELLTCFNDGKSVPGILKIFGKYQTPKIEENTYGSVDSLDEDFDSEYIIGETEDIYVEDVKQKLSDPIELIKEFKRNI